jgi:hypothetical protein
VHCVGDKTQGLIEDIGGWTEVELIEIIVWNSDFVIAGVFGGRTGLHMGVGSSTGEA